MSPNLVIVPKTKLAERLATVVVAACIAALLYSIFKNPHFEWQIVFANFTVPAMLKGLLVTLELTFFAVFFGFPLGTIVAAMRQADSKLLQSVSWFYVWVFRSVPMLVQLFFWFNIAALYPRLALTLPGLGELYSFPTNHVLTGFSAAVLALVLHDAAYTSEIIRTGLRSVPTGQRDAARALGFTNSGVMYNIVFPQAFRVILPAAGNQIISTLKATSVVSVIALKDVLYSAQEIYERTYDVIPLLIVASLWYLVVTSLLSMGQYWIEGRLSRKDEPL
ncbi:ABC transporter polar amino acid permease inner membrane subunit [Acetobacter orientalis]|uniref:Glutamate/aspartate import permease protein GltK n=2 Tax=Acetobacter orientalis TaxID=146474 RepID=A0A2Z5ZH17_9PROT|nr:amino acid ABC transporter permease [Acetobacter orientalis]BBC80012.1 ABC transporter polar amino acid permease inner membrane subunit [Acetobacter orientalis]GAN66141.1 ABC transporter polar amino acid permease inner membrane subunit [Acetobacter orientalis]GBR15339.1 amino acid ABC transporter permease [Acetobacter orientalis NRIC 0481]GEL62610.1 putative amino acid ABC transporter, permease protein [Acetobacter orientalis]